MKTEEAPEEEGKKGTPSFKLEGPRVPPFYSALRRTIEQKMGGSMPIPQLRVLLKQPGIKQEEVKWSGIDDFLAAEQRETETPAQNRITKQEVLAFLDANRIEIQEVAKANQKQIGT